MKKHFLEYHFFFALFSVVVDCILIIFYFAIISNSKTCETPSCYNLFYKNSVIIWNGTQQVDFHRIGRKAWHEPVISLKWMKKLSCLRPTSSSHDTVTIVCTNQMPHASFVSKYFLPLCIKRKNISVSLFAGQKSKMPHY